MNISLADSHSKIRRLLHLNLTYAYKLLRLCHAPSSLAVIEIKIKYITVSKLSVPEKFSNDDGHDGNYLVIQTQLYPLQALQAFDNMNSKH